MNKVKAFVKKYWVTFLIFAGLAGLYYYSTEFGNANPFLFPKVGSIAKVFASDASLMGTNLVASVKIMIPSIRMIFVGWIVIVLSERSWIV